MAVFVPTGLLSVWPSPPLPVPTALVHPPPRSKGGVINMTYRVIVLYPVVSEASQTSEASKRTERARVRQEEGGGMGGAE